MELLSLEELKKYANVAPWFSGGHGSAGLQ